MRWIIRENLLGTQKLHNLPSKRNRKIEYRQNPENYLEKGKRGKKLQKNLSIFESGSSCRLFLSSRELARSHRNASMESDKYILHIPAICTVQMSHLDHDQMSH